MFECLSCLVVGIAHQRRGQRWPRIVDRNQIGAVAREACASRLRDFLLLLVGVLRKLRVQKSNEGDVETVHPDDRFVGLVLVIVPLQRRRQHEIAGIHLEPLAVHRRGRAFALEHEAQRALAVAVLRRDFARQHELDPGIERVGDRGLVGQAGVLQHQHAALGFFGGDEVAGLEQQRTHIGEAPMRRLHRRHRLGRDEVPHHLPQRRHVPLRKPAVEPRELVGVLARARHAVHHTILVTSPTRH